MQATYRLGIADHIARKRAPWALVVPVLRRGFTLIELLVVIAIISLLIAVLMPGLRQAREQARRAVCASNLSSIATSLLSYQIETNSVPVLPCGTTTFGWCTWSYGGWTGANAAFWQAYNGGMYFWPTDQRPISRYLTRGAVTSATQMPVFSCPSDSVELIHLLQQGAGQVLGQFDSYDDVGTSFRLNYHWYFPYAEYFASLPGCGANPSHVMGAALAQANGLFRRYSERNASRFILLNEEPANFGFFNHKSVIGFHRQFARHNFAFMDRHVEYLHADTAKTRDAFWTVVDENPITVPCP